MLGITAILDSSAPRELPYSCQVSVPVQEILCPLRSEAEKGVKVEVLDGCVAQLSLMQLTTGLSCHLSWVVAVLAPLLSTLDIVILA